jgi:hypothetical protein
MRQLQHIRHYLFNRHSLIPVMRPKGITLFPCLS